jgi:hypothetical protein
MARDISASEHQYLLSSMSKTLSTASTYLPENLRRYLWNPSKGLIWSEQRVGIISIVTLISSEIF